MRSGSVFPVLMISLLMMGSFSASFWLAGSVGGSISFEKDKRINLDTGSAEQASPCVAASGNDVYVFWQDGRYGNWDIYSRASHDGGLTFGPEVRVDDTKRTSTMADDVSDQVAPRAAVDIDGNIYVVWGDNRDGRSLIYYSVSNDRGASFLKNVRVSDHFTGSQTHPDLDISPAGSIHVVWEDTRDRSDYPRIYGSTDDGDGFGPAVRISDISTSYRCLGPRVSSPVNSSVHVVWYDDRVWDQDIYLASSFDDGSTFDPSVRVDRDPSGSDQTDPDIAGNETDLFIVWKDPRSGSSDIYMAISGDSGSTFGPDRCINPGRTSGAQFDPGVDIDPSGNITVVWTSSPGIADTRSDIQMTRIYANGTSDMVYTVNDPLPGYSQDTPSTAAGSHGMAFFAWRDSRGSAGNDIYFSRTTVSGEAGSAPGLSDGQVNPWIGPVGQRFDFRVTYSDIENDPPASGYPKLNLFYRTATGDMFPFPGSPFNMTLRMMPVPDYDFRNGETYIYSVVVDRELDLFYYFSAVAASGNSSETRTDILNMPVMDDEGPSFALISPEENQWLSENIINFRVNITDALSGVDPWSIFYQTYQEEKGGWERWQRKGSVVSINGSSVIYSVNVTFLEGKGNMIRFRAKDVLGNGGISEDYSMSKSYNVWVDATGPTMRIISPRSGSIFSDTTINFEALVQDAGVGTDPSSIQVSYSLNGVENFGAWQNLSVLKGNIVNEDGGYHLFFNLSLFWGYYNMVRIRAGDLLGNTVTSSNVQVIARKEETKLTDRPPSAVTSIQPKISGSVRPHITWSPSFDPDGTLVTYNITVFDTTSGEPIVVNEPIIPGDTYWDPEPESQFVPGHIYLISIVSVSGGLEGPEANSTLLISTNANHPPDQVSHFEPRATSLTSPVMRWEPSSDPDGDEVYYFIRIGRYYGGSDVLPWTSVLNETRYAMGKQLTVGVYYVDILCSDGKDFAPISHFSMSLGVYNPVLKVQRSQIVVYKDSGATINITLSNRGFTFDNMKLRLDGEALQRVDIEMNIGKDRIELAPGSSVNTTFHVDAFKDAKPGLYTLNITVISVDGISTYTKPLSIRVVDPNDIPVTNRPGGEKTSDNARTVMILFIIILVMVIGAMIYAYYRIDRREREERVEVVGGSRPGMVTGPRRKELKSAERDGKAALPPKKPWD